MRSKDVLLGLLSLHPGASGYQIRKIVDSVTGFFFSISLSQIYPLLRELSEDGLVTYEVQNLVGKQDRKVYTITAAGRAHLTEVLSEPFEPEYSLIAFRDFLLRLNLMAEFDNNKLSGFLEEAAAAFRQHLRRAQEEAVDASREYLTLGGRDQQRYLALWQRENRYLTADLENKIRWIEEFRLDLDSELGE